MGRAYDIVRIARSGSRPTGADYIRGIFSPFIELHGDRRYRDDEAIIGGIAYLKGKPVTVIGIEKGHNTIERMRRSFGAPEPEGYRKALRLMKQAEKFHRPVILFVDTSGAFCGIGAEERGQGQAIAENLMEMMGLKTPELSILIGEGGSGGALALAVSDRVWMLENAVYVYGLDIVVETDNTVQESDVLVAVGDMLKILHADNSDSIFQIVHQSVILIDKDDAALAPLYGFVGQIDHLLGLAAALVSH